MIDECGVCDGESLCRTIITLIVSDSSSQRRTLSYIPAPHIQPSLTEQSSPETDRTNTDTALTFLRQLHFFCPPYIAACLVSRTNKTPGLRSENKSTRGTLGSIARGYLWLRNDTHLWERARAFYTPALGESTTTPIRPDPVEPALDAVASHHGRERALLDESDAIEAELQAFVCTRMRLLPDLCDLVTVSKLGEMSNGSSTVRTFSSGRLLSQCIKATPNNHRLSDMLPYFVGSSHLNSLCWVDPFACFL